MKGVVTCSHACRFSPCDCITQGSYYYFDGVKLAQGRDNVLLHLGDNPDTAARITTAVKQKLQEGGGKVKVVGNAASTGSFVDDELDFDEDELIDDDALAQDFADQRDRLGGS